MASNSKFINAYLDVCKGSTYALANEEALGETEKPRTLSIIDSYIQMLTPQKKPKISLTDFINKYIDIYNTINNKDPLFLLDCIFLFVRFLNNAHVDMANPIKEAYIVYRNSYGVEEININLKNYYLSVFKLVTGFGVTNFFSENEFRTAWTLALVNGVLPTAQIIDNSENVDKIKNAEPINKIF